jgi:hypothetical protein
MSLKVQDWLLVLRERIFPVILVSFEKRPPALLILIQAFLGWRGFPKPKSTGKLIVLFARLSICFILVV